MDSNGSHKPLVNVTDMSQEQIENMLRQMAEMKAEMESYKKELNGLRQVVKGQSSVIVPQIDEEATSRRKLLKRVAAGAAGIGALAMVANVSRVAMAENVNDNGVTATPGPEGYGGRFETGGLAPLYLQPSTTLGAPTNGTSARQIGELSVDSAGELYLCVVGGVGAAAKWRKLGGINTAGALHFLQPVPNRYADTRSALGGINGQITAGNTKTFLIGGAAGERTPFTVIPANAVGVLGNITAANVAIGGLFKVFPAGGDPTNATSTINFNTGVNTANSFSSPLGTGGANAGKLSVLSGGATADFFVDVVGYYL